MVHPTNQPTVLVVDDEPSMQTFLTQFLQRRGYRVKSAATAADAIAVLQQARVAAIVLDVRMPGRSGLDVLEHVRFDPVLEDMPVLILTGAQLTAEEEAVIASRRAYVFYKQENFADFGKHLDKVTQPVD